MADRTVRLTGPGGPVDVVYHDNGDGTYSATGLGNIEGTLLASAARTATGNSTDQTNHNSSGVMVALNVTVAGVDGGLTLRIQWKDPISGNYINLNAAPTTVTGTGTTVYAFGPGATTAGGVTQGTAGLLPRTWRISVVASNSTSYTYSVGYALMV